MCVQLLTEGAVEEIKEGGRNPGGLTACRDREFYVAIGIGDIGLYHAAAWNRRKPDEQQVEQQLYLVLCDKGALADELTRDLVAASGDLHFFVGVGIAFGSTFWSAWRRRHTWYTLTDRRAFIATDLPFRGRSLKSYPITKSTVIDYDGGTPASIMFNHEMRRKKNGHYRVDVGFERIENGAEVYRMMRDIQKGQAV